MEALKKGKVRQLYEADFKDELIRMMNSGKNVQEISETFGIRRNVLYSWIGTPKRMNPIQKLRSKIRKIKAVIH